MVRYGVIGGDPDKLSSDHATKVIQHIGNQPIKEIKYVNGSLDDLIPIKPITYQHKSKYHG